MELTISGYSFQHESNSSLIRELSRNNQLRVITGFAGRKLPNSYNYTRFFDNLSKHTEESNRNLTNIGTYNIIKESLCTAYKTTVQTEQAMNLAKGSWGWAVAKRQQMVLSHICGTVVCSTSVFFYTLFGTSTVKSLYEITKLTL